MPDEVQEQFYKAITIPFIKWLIAEDRPRAKDLPRDERGRIIVDVTKPHILEDMDYFRPTALHFQKTGRLTDLRPNSNPRSSFGQWFMTEVIRCLEGYVRESDGEWVTGDMYYFLNYCPIEQSKIVVGSSKASRIIDFPEVWDGIYLRYHYMEQAAQGGLFDQRGGLNGCEISSRGKAKSLSMAAKLSKFFILGESREVNQKVKVVAAAYTKEYLNGNDGLLTKVQNFLDFAAKETQFPHLMLRNSLQDMQWQLGWKDLVSGARMGTLNQLSGIAIKDDISKIRGKRQNFIVCEEFGSFPGIRALYNIMLPCVREGDYSFGQMYLVGTSGDKDSDFQQATELVYNPRGYYMYPLPNVYDYPGEGRSEITFFYPEYLNRKGYYDANGNSNVTGALVALLLDRYHVKYNTTDLGTITKSICERPITPQEAIMRSSGNKFPVVDLNQRLNELDNDSRAFDDVYVGDLVEMSNGEVEFKTTADIPIRKYPIDNNMTAGALEIYAMPEKNKEGKVPYGRYICACDPIDQDSTTDSSSLYSTFVLDLFTDNIVAEYTGRKEYAKECYEVTRKLCKFYNCQCLYENNVKGLFAYFSEVNCLNLLADTPEYLQDKQLTKISHIGNNSKGVRATNPINNYADDLIREWLIQPEPFISKDENGKDIEGTRRHLFSIRNRALLQELICYNPYVNVDRVRALGMLMLFREQFMINNHGKISAEDTERRDRISEDPFFERNFNIMYTWS